MQITSYRQIKPLYGKQPKQLVIFLHGLGADENDLIGLAQEFNDLLPDAHFISPNAPFLCDMAPYGYQWFSLQDRNADAMHQGIKRSAPILEKFIEERLKEFDLEYKDLILIGFSQGTMMSLHLAPRLPKSISAVIGYSGALLKPNLLKDEVKSHPKTLLIHGSIDEIVNAQELTAAKNALNAANIPVDSHLLSNLGHAIDMRGIEKARNFLKNL